MATYYVNSGAGGLNDGTSWTDAYTSIQSGLDAITNNGDEILVHYAHAQGDTAGAIGKDINVDWAMYSVDKDNSNALTAQNGTTEYIFNQDDIFFLGGTGRAYIYGVAIIRTSGTARTALSRSDESDYLFEDCIIDAGTGNTHSIQIGDEFLTGNSWATFINCTFDFNNAAQQLRLYMGSCEFINCDVTGTSLTNFCVLHPDGSAYAKWIGCDVSSQTGNLSPGISTGRVEFLNCKMASSYTPLGTGSDKRGDGDVLIIDSANGDTHNTMSYDNAYGALDVVTDTYITSDGASYDGTSRYGWKIVTTSSCSFERPFKSPWFGVYHDGTSSITPYVEIFLDGSTTALQDDEIWVEFAYKTPAGSTAQAEFQITRMTPRGTPANIVAGVGESSWTTAGGAGSSGTDWSGKISATAFTPSEIGYIYARVVVGEPSTTVYVDPKVRT